MLDPPRPWECRPPVPGPPLAYGLERLSDGLAGAPLVVAEAALGGPRGSLRRRGEGQWMRRGGPVGEDEDVACIHHRGPDPDPDPDPKLWMSSLWPAERQSTRLAEIKRRQIAEWCCVACGGRIRASGGPTPHGHTYSHLSWAKRCRSCRVAAQPLRAGRHDPLLLRPLLSSLGSEQ